MTKNFIDSNSSLQSDSEIFELIQAETSRQQDGLEMIASENTLQSGNAARAQFLQQYAEGYPVNLLWWLPLRQRS